MIAAMTMAVALGIGPVAPPPEAPKQDTFTPEERRQALEALRTIGKAFEDRQAPAPAPQGKSMADVADKALDISTKYIGQAASIIEKAAPRVWAVMVRQQYAKAIGEILGPFLWMLMIPLLAATVRHFWKPRPIPENHNCRTEACGGHASSDERACHIAFTLAVPAAGTAIAGAVFIYNLAQSSMYLINPEYYAIKDLVQILLHPGSL